MRRKLIIVAISMLPVVANAAGKDPSDYTLREFGFYLCTALFGGVVNWLNKLIRKEAAALDLLRLIGELATSAFVGLVVFFACEAFNVPKLMTICVVAVAGHMGTRALLHIETVVTRFAVRRFGIQDPASENRNGASQ